MRRLFNLALRVGWLAICVIPLRAGIEALRDPEDPANLYGMVVFHDGMTILTFPLGWFAWYGLYGIFVLLRPIWPVLVWPPVQLWVFWVVLVMVGYCQWFKLLPYVISAGWRPRSPAAH